MPNWCYNEVVISNDSGLDNSTPIKENLIQRPITNISDSVVRMVEDITFNRLVPEPTGNEASNDWYNWRLEHWGVKWDASDTNFYGECPYIVTFNTAWGAPRPWFLALSKAYPAYKFEIDCDYEGEDENDLLIYKRGELISDASYTPDCSECGCPVNDHADDCENHPDYDEDYEENEDACHECGRDDGYHDEACGEHEEYDEDDNGDADERKHIHLSKIMAKETVDCPLGHCPDNDCASCLFGEENHLVGIKCLPR